MTLTPYQPMIVEGDNLAILFHVGGDAQHLLHGAFAHQQMIALAVFHHNRQANFEFEDV